MVAQPLRARGPLDCISSQFRRFLIASTTASSATLFPSQFFSKSLVSLRALIKVKVERWSSRLDPRDFYCALKLTLDFPPCQHPALPSQSSHVDTADPEPNAYANGRAPRPSAPTYGVSRAFPISPVARCRPLALVAPSPVSDPGSQSHRVLLQPLRYGSLQPSAGRRPRPAT